jgi:hypothetical protein
MDKEPIEIVRDFKLNNIMIDDIKTEKSLSQLKRFIVKEMKSQSADWSETKIQPSYGPDQKGFKSEYLKILKEIKRNNDADDNRP